MLCGKIVAEEGDLHNVTADSLSCHVERMHMKPEVAWKKYDEADLAEVERIAAAYIDFISENKTEREFTAAAIALAEEAGYKDLLEMFANGTPLKPGDKVYAQKHGKTVIFAHIGTDPLKDGMNILGAHVDSPRLDLKQNPLVERNGLLHLDTHYYGGIKPYQWVTIPLACEGRRHEHLRERRRGRGRSRVLRVRPADSPCTRTNGEERQQGRGG